MFIVFNETFTPEMSTLFCWKNWPCTHGGGGGGGGEVGGWWGGGHCIPLFRIAKISHLPFQKSAYKLEKYDVNNKFDLSISFCHQLNYIRENKKTNRISSITVLLANDFYTSIPSVYQMMYQN